MKFHSQVLNLPIKQGSSVNIETLGYGLGDRGSVSGTGIDGIILRSPPHPGQIWGQPNLLSNGYRGLLPRGE